MQLIRTGTNFASYRLGSIEIVALRDGYVDMPTSRLRQSGDLPFGEHLPDRVVTVDGNLRLSVNAFLIRNGDDHILIDTGAANAWKPSMGLLMQGLAEAGVSPNAIRRVALTHTHIDHVNGLVAADGTSAFPNLASLHVPAKEVELFRSEARLARYHASCLPISDGDLLGANITAQEAPGHEVGHTCFHVSGGDETLLIWGDIVHVPSIQFARPDLTWEFDASQDQARVSRERMLRLAARPKVAVAGAHLDFPGIGIVSVGRDEAAYAFSAI